MEWIEKNKVFYGLTYSTLYFVVDPYFKYPLPDTLDPFSGWILSLEYHNYPMSNHHLEITDQHKTLKTEPGLTLGFGLATLAITMVPILNFIVIPAAICGATALYLEKLKV